MWQLLASFAGLFGALFGAHLCFAQLTATGIGAGGFGATGGCASTPTLDPGLLGNGGYQNQGATISSIALSGSGSQFTSSQTNTLVIAAISNWNTQAHGTAPTVSTVVDGGSTSYTKLGAFAFQETDVFGPARGQQFVDLEIWYHFYASVQTGQNVTVTLSGTADGVILQMLGMFNVNSGTPWDPDASLPATGQGNENGSLSVTGKSTTNSCTRGFALAANITNAGLNPPGTAGGSSWTALTGLSQGQMASQMQTTSAFTSAQSGTFGFTIGSGFFGSIGVIFAAPTS